MDEVSIGIGILRVAFIISFVEFYNDVMKRVSLDTL